MPFLAMEKPIEEQSFSTKVYRQEEIVIEGEEIGYALYVQTTSTSWHLMCLFVEPSYRKSGYGRLLLKKCYDSIKNNNGTEITIDVIPMEEMTDQDLINFYKKTFKLLDPDAQVIIEQEDIFPSTRITVKLSA